MDDKTRLLDTVGQMAGGIAHDFNNLLTAILGHVELLSDDLGPGDPRAAEVRGIRHAAERAAELTQQLLAFSRRQTLQPTVLDLNDVVDRTRRALDRVVGGTIDIVTCPASDLWRVKADGGQIEQSLLKLAVNARDAMPDGGRLTLETHNVTVDDAAAGAHGIEAGDYVRLSVVDTGIGMDDETRRRAFDPFFTTKPRRNAAGLGLAMVYGVVTQSGGHIAVESEPGRGTRFDILLPATVEPPAHADIPDRAARAARGSETVLLVEDDGAVRSLIGQVLQRRGYHLLVAEDGPQALRLADTYTSPIHLLITDMVIPGMNGAAVAEAVRVRRPDTRVLFVSGYTAESATELGGDDGAAFLHKPFTPDALARKVRAILEIGTA